MNERTKWVDILDEFSEGVGSIAGLWGVSPTIGRLYGVLFLSADPLSVTAIAERAGVAKSTASSGLRVLERQYVVRRVHKPSGGRPRFVAVTDPIEIVRRWISSIFEPELNIWLDIARSTLSRLSELEGDEALTAAEHQVLATRLDGLERGAKSAAALLSLVRRFLGGGLGA